MAEQPLSDSGPSVVTITSSDQPSVAKLTSVLASAFVVVPMNVGFICDEDKIQPPFPSPAVDSDRFYKHFERKIEKIATGDATLLQAGDWSAVAIWEPPNYINPRAGDAQDPTRVLFEEWRSLLKVIKAKHLAKPVQNGLQNSSVQTVNSPETTSAGLRPYYHLGFLARNPNSPAVPGAITALIEPYLRRARDENLPVWLEAGGLHAVDVYRHFGFRLVEVIPFGIGRYGPDGWPKEGGEGVCGYAMIYDAHLTS